MNRSNQCRYAPSTSTSDNAASPTPATECARSQRHEAPISDHRVISARGERDLTPRTAQNVIQRVNGTEGRNGGMVCRGSTCRYGESWSSEECRDSPRGLVLQRVSQPPSHPPCKRTPVFIGQTATPDPQPDPGWGRGKDGSDPRKPAGFRPPPLFLRHTRGVGSLPSKGGPSGKGCRLAIRVLAPRLDTSAATSTESVRGRQGSPLSRRTGVGAALTRPVEYGRVDRFVSNSGREPHCPR